MNSMCHECIKTTHLLLGVGNHKESYDTTIKRVCREIIKTTCLLLGVAKCKEYKNPTNKRHVNIIDKDALRTRAYSCRSPSTRSTTQTIT